MNPYDEIFVERLGLLNCARILLSSRRRRARSIWCRKSGSIAGLLFGRKLRSIEDYLYASYRGSNYCDVRAIWTIETARRLFKSETNRYLARFYRQSFATSVYHAVGLIQDQDLTPGAGGKRVCIMVPTRVFLDVLRSAYQKPGVDITWGFSDRKLQDETARFLSYFYMIVRAAASGGQASVAAPPAISVLNFRGGNSPKQRHDLFWLGDSPAQHPVIFEYASPAYALSSEFVDFLMSRGIRIVETHTRGRVVQGSNLWKPGRLFLASALSAIRSLLPSLFKALRQGDWIDAWRAWRRFDFDVLVGIRTDFYQAFNIKAEFISGLTFVEAAHSYALSRLGGMTCTAQYTTTIDPQEGHTSVSAFHLHFGDYIRTWNLPLEAEFSILNGYLFKSALVSGVEEARLLKRRIAEAGIQKSVLFLDEGFYEYAAMDRAVVELLTYLLNKVANEPAFGIVIKPKKNKSIDGLRKELGPTFKRAMDSRRLFILDWSHYPGIAAQSVDLTVGVLSTAAIEAAIMDCPTIYLNPLGYVLEYMKPVRANIFDTAAETIETIDRFFKGSHPGIGRHSEEFLRSIDHHRDNGSSSRIRHLLFGFLDEIKKGNPRDIALSNTASSFHDIENADRLLV